MKKDVTVTFNVSVEVDETKFTPEYLKIMQEVFCDFDTIEEHIEYIATLKVRDMLEDGIEMYGKLSSMGIKARINNVDSVIDD